MNYTPSPPHNLDRRHCNTDVLVSRKESLVRTGAQVNGNLRRFYEILEKLRK